jgi:subtilisin family serine protease
LTLLSVLLLCGCGAKQQTDGRLAEPPVFMEQASDFQDAGLLQLPGDASLAAGLRNVPDPSAEQPMPRQTARAGVDFASNRFVVVFENQPDPAALSAYMGGGTAADIVTPRDNAPLVQHQFLRRVSHNLATQYGLSIYGRVFFRDVNFAAYEVPGLSDVSQLDAMMQRVLSENRGLVREVNYDFYVSIRGTVHTEPVPLNKAEIAEVMRKSPAAPRTGQAEALRTASAPPNDPMHLNVNGSDGGTWANWRIGAIDTQAWDSTVGSPEVVLAIVDTGVRYTHEDLAANTIEPAATFPYNQPGILTDVINKDNDPNDDHGHGTYCSGIAGAVGNNGLGLSGANQSVSILPIKVLSGGGSGSETQVAEGMLLADYLGVNIINMSLGGPFPDRIMQLAAVQCHNDGVLVVVAAGNDGWGGLFYPAYYPECLGVGATTLVNDANNEDFSQVAGEIPTAERFDARAGFSNYGSWVDIAAPGVQVRSTSAGSDSSYGASGAGTSFACPYTAGCAALLWAHMGLDSTNVEVRGLLQSSATVMDHVNNGANPRGFVDNDSNGSVRFVNVWEAIKLHDAGPYEAPSVSWVSPVAGSTVSGLQDLQLSVSGGSGNVLKVEFETPTRHLGTVTAESGGFWQIAWDTVFEFNRGQTVTATLYDDVGHIISLPLQVICDNPHVVPAWTEDFDGVPDDALPAGWSELDGNIGAGGNTSWGADASQFVTAAPGMHSSGSTGNYASRSNDWLYAPVLDLTGFASASLSFQRRYVRGSNDFFYFFASADDETYAGDAFTAGGLQDWAEYTFDLTPFCGAEVRLFWVLTANGGGQDVGMWIDDVSVSVPTGIAPTVEITSPQAGASVQGLVPVELTLSDDTVALELIGSPVHVGSIWFTDLPDNDPDNPTKTFSLDWDSRRSWNGNTLLRARVYDDESDNGGTDDLAAEDSVSVFAANPLQSASWLEDFESIGDLGGIDNGQFDGLWYRWGGDDPRWRSASFEPWRGAQHAWFGPDGGGPYDANSTGRIYSPVFDLSAAGSPYLRFWHNLDVEAGNGDRAMLYLVRSDGVHDLELNLLELRSDSGGWQRLLLDLSTYKATPFRLMFLFAADGDAEAGNGWSLDDIEIVDASPAIFGLYRPRGYPGQPVTINGSSFGILQDTSTVSFAKLGGGRSDAVVDSWSDGLLTVTVPADATSGDVIVTVLGKDSNPRHFSVLLDPTVLVDIGQF